MPISSPQVPPPECFSQNVSKHSLTEYLLASTLTFQTQTFFLEFSILMLPSGLVLDLTFLIPWVEYTAFWPLVFLFCNLFFCLTALQPQITSKKGCMESKLCLSCLYIGAKSLEWCSRTFPSSSNFLYCVGRVLWLDPITIDWEYNFSNHFQNFTFISICSF